MSTPTSGADNPDTSGADLPDDSVLDSLRGAVDPLEARHESDPAHPTDFRTQVTRFFLTGVLSAVVDYGLLQLFMLFGLGYGPAKALSFVAGTLTAYSLNRRWTFQAEPSRARFVATMGLYALMFGVQWGLFMLLVPWFHDLGWSTFWATTVGYVIAQGVATVTNFIVQRTVIFRVR
ncbi:GtrA family protein [Dietzia psychralcaliphila]|uniref:GtrA family protein n=1 Tax=Dietzia psychralcaliphila TaxID=139021 RepID=UPI001C1E1095|nr:GtrA family protein [Dietzia psychralcaliphila]